jgi:class 3 adenylate cyclase
MQGRMPASSFSQARPTVRAAIMICDLRDFTRISDNRPRDYVIDLLNDYFDAMSLFAYPDWTLINRKVPHRP